MSRDLSAIQQLRSSAELLAFMEEAPGDRVIHYTSNLAPDEFNGSIAVRNDDVILVVCSMQAAGANTVKAFVDVLRAQGFVYGSHPHEIGVIANAQHDSLGLLRIPEDIQMLLDDAVDEKPKGELACAGFEDLFVLASHPDAESRA